MQATLKLEEMNYQLKNVNSNSEKLIIMSVTDEMIKNVINDGHYILEKTPKAKVFAASFFNFFFYFNFPKICYKYLF